MAALGENPVDFSATDTESGSGRDKSTKGVFDGVQLSRYPPGSARGKGTLCRSCPRPFIKPACYFQFFLLKNNFKRLRSCNAAATRQTLPVSTQPLSAGAQALKQATNPGCKSGRDRPARNKGTGILSSATSRADQWSPSFIAITFK